ncbi:MULTISPECIES: betaine/proline/choline family ABC transporter ATP-binding protein [Burkholderiaceae]|uniref:betaine/proline/choline family ABC transporter ATP-binding protein n=1 Tax=Burkholderiaceae TaxID=119060 RepID=UPI001966267B|nr:MULTISPECIES: betaine/proline/choline family ABC transporter ATP-binding protein [Burkholderiaceae]
MMPEPSILRPVHANAKPVIRSTPSAVTQQGETVIECRDIWKLYGRRAKEALASIKREGIDKDEVKRRFDCVVGVAGVSFTVSRGETLCIMGLSGCGKSTLLRHINRLIDPTAGEIWIEGEQTANLKAKPLRELRAKRFGMVFQNMALWPHFTVLENVLFVLQGRGLSRSAQLDAARSALAAVRLSGWEHHYPDQLSGGMQQRVGLARALSTDPDILLMDEPFSALDPIVRRELAEQFVEVSRRLGKTAVFITHDLDEAIRIGDRVAVMKDGKIVQIGTPFDVVNMPVNDYVKDFAKGVGRLQVLTAGAMMRQFTSGLPHDVSSHRSIDLDARLPQVLDAFGGDSRPLAVMHEKEVVGVIDYATALAAIRSKLD